MNVQLPINVSSAFIEANSHYLKHEGNKCSTVVGGGRRAMSDAEIEQHIASCTYLMESAWADYEESGCLGARGTADRWRVLRDEAVQAARARQARGINGR